MRITGRGTNPSGSGNDASRQVDNLPYGIAARNYKPAWITTPQARTTNPATA
jgi:hypothetical protein